jgi:hypothetical protein
MLSAEHSVCFKAGDNLVKDAAARDAGLVRQRGIIDGTMNNADIVDHISILDTAIDADVEVSENRNSNTKAQGYGNNSFQK